MARLALLLPLALLAAGPAPAGGESRYEKFLRQHVAPAEPGPPDPRRYCDLLMRRRGMAGDRGCKRLNTFVHGGPERIGAVCGPGGEPAGGDLRLSEDAFPLTLCRLRGGARPPDCAYSGSASTQRIVIACVDGRPVHFETQVESRAGAGAGKRARRPFPEPSVWPQTLLGSTPESCLDPAQTLPGSTPESCLDPASDQPPNPA